MNTYIYIYICKDIWSLCQCHSSSTEDTHCKYCSRTPGHSGIDLIIRGTYLTYGTTWELLNLYNVTKILYKILTESALGRAQGFVSRLSEKATKKIPNVPDIW